MGELGAGCANPGTHLWVTEGLPLVPSGGRGLPHTLPALHESLRAELGFHWKTLHPQPFLPKTANLSHGFRREMSCHSHWVALTSGLEGGGRSLCLLRRGLDQPRTETEFQRALTWGQAAAVPLTAFSSPPNHPFLEKR